MRDTMDMAREAGADKPRSWPIEYWRFADDELKAFEALVRADEREETNRRANASWTLMCEKMVAAEREACAKLFESHEGWLPSETVAAAIRSRENT